MDKIERKAIIDRVAHGMREETFKELVFGGWLMKFQEKLESLVMDKFGLDGLKDVYGSMPWDNHNLFTGYKHRFYFSDDPEESAEQYFNENLGLFGTVELSLELDEPVQTPIIPPPKKAVAKRKPRCKK